MDEEIDIYGDLDDYDNAVLSEKNLQLVNELENEKIVIRAQLDDIIRQKTDLEFKFKRLEENMSTLILTAKCEIERKNDTINTLRKEKDDIAFRRRKVSKCSTYSQTSVFAYSSNKGIQVDEHDLKRSFRRYYSPERNYNRAKRDSRHLYNQNNSDDDRNSKKYRYDRDRSKEKRRRRDDNYYKDQYRGPHSRVNLELNQNDEIKLGEFIPRKVSVVQEKEEKILDKIDNKQNKRTVVHLTDDSDNINSSEYGIYSSPPGKNDILCALHLQPTPRKIERDHTLKNRDKIESNSNYQECHESEKSSQPKSDIITTHRENQKTNCLDAALAQLNEESMNGFEKESEVNLNDSIESSALEIACEEEEQLKLQNQKTDPQKQLNEKKQWVKIDITPGTERSDDITKTKINFNNALEMNKKQTTIKKHSAKDEQTILFKNGDLKKEESMNQLVLKDKGVKIANKVDPVFINKKDIVEASPRKSTRLTSTKRQSLQTTTNEQTSKVESKDEGLINKDNVKSVLVKEIKSNAVLPKSRKQASLKEKPIIQVKYEEIKRDNTYGEHKEKEPVTETDKATNISYEMKIKDSGKNDPRKSPSLMIKDQLNTAEIEELIQKNVNEIVSPVVKNIEKLPQTKDKETFKRVAEKLNTEQPVVVDKIIEIEPETNGSTLAENQTLAKLRQEIVLVEEKQPNSIKEAVAEIQKPILKAKVNARKLKPRPNIILRSAKATKLDLSHSIHPNTDEKKQNNKATLKRNKSKDKIEVTKDFKNEHVLNFNNINTMLSTSNDSKAMSADNESKSYDPKTSSNQIFNVESTTNQIIIKENLQIDEAIDDGQKEKLKPDEIIDNFVKPLENEQVKEIEIQEMPQHKVTSPPVGTLLQNNKFQVKSLPNINLTNKKAKYEVSSSTQETVPTKILRKSNENNPTDVIEIQQEGFGTCQPINKIIELNETEDKQKFHEIEEVAGQSDPNNKISSVINQDNLIDSLNSPIPSCSDKNNLMLVSSSSNNEDVTHENLNDYKLFNDIPSNKSKDELNISTGVAKSSPPMVSKRFLVERFEVNGENNEPTLYLSRRKKVKKSKK